jgi:hypothetical protein
MNVQDGEEFERHVVALEEIIKRSGEVLEGNCVYKNQTLKRVNNLESKRRNLFRAGSKARRICEIGFNAGHSATILALASKRTFGAESEMVLFDLGFHSYTRPCYDYLQSAIGAGMSEFKIHYGDSRIMLPMWIEANKEHLGTFDLVHVDGGHTKDCAASDLLCAALLTRPGGTIIVDDIDSKKILPIVNAWTFAGYLRLDQETGYEVSQRNPHTFLIKYGT